MYTVFISEHLSLTYFSSMHPFSCTLFILKGRIVSERGDNSFKMRCDTLWHSVTPAFVRGTASAVGSAGVKSISRLPPPPTLCFTSPSRTR